MKIPFLVLLVSLLAACSENAIKSEGVHSAKGQSSLVYSVTPNSSDSLRKPYVILVSIDGYRPDYTAKYGPPVLSEIRNTGAVADAMVPVFPSKTFPNHLSLITGMQAEHHGIVANYFFDFSRPLGKQVYLLSDTAAVSDGTWYQAEPFWVTAEKQGMRTACFFWPASEAQIHGVRPSYYKAYDHTVTNAQRVDGVLDWLKLPESVRPHFITLYFSDVDSKGHQFGPDSAEVKNAVLEIDQQLGRLFDGIKSTGLPVNVVIVSDHGMAMLDQKKIIYLDDLVDLSGVTVGDTGPQMILYAGNSTQDQSQSGQEKEGKIEKIYQVLKQKEHHFKVYLRSEIPKEFHLGMNPRAGDLLINAELPYSVGYHNPHFHLPVATHGYDPIKYPQMNAIFYAQGPNIRHKKVKKFKNVDVYPFLIDLLKLKPDHTVDGTDRVLKKIIQ